MYIITVFDKAEFIKAIAAGYLYPINDYIIVNGDDIDTSITRIDVDDFDKINNQYVITNRFVIEALDKYYNGMTE